MALNPAAFRFTAPLPAAGRLSAVLYRALRIVGVYLVAGLACGIFVLSLQFTRLWAGVGILFGLVCGYALLVALVDFAVSSEILKQIFQISTSTKRRYHFDSIYRAILITYAFAGAFFWSPEA